ncbi:hypothetical protein AAMO2058_000537100 [Amorphochlora amoebiformis]
MIDDSKTPINESVRYSDSDAEEPPSLPTRRPPGEGKAVWHSRINEYREACRARIRRAMIVRRELKEWDIEHKHDPAYCDRVRELKWAPGAAVEAALSRERKRAEGKGQITAMEVDEEGDDEGSGVRNREGKGALRTSALETKASCHITTLSPTISPPNSFSETRFFVAIHEKLDEKYVRRADGEEGGGEGGEFWRVNVAVHMWRFPFFQFGVEDQTNAPVNIGLYDTEGLLAPETCGALDDPEILLESQMREQEVCIHDRHFSPNNCVILVDRAAAYASFFLLASYDDRRVISFHILPIQERVARALEGVTSTASHVEVVLESLVQSRTHAVRLIGEKLSGLIHPFLGF